MGNVTRRGVLSASAVAAASLAGGLSVRADELDEGAAAGSDAALAPSEVVRYLYIDCLELEAGGTQNVVLALEELGSEVTDAALALVHSDTGETSLHELSASSDSALLFAFDVDGEGTYEVVDVTLALADGSTLAVDFSDVDTSYRSFVVSAAEATELSETGEEETELTVYTMDVDGNTSEESSIESGIATVSGPSARQTYSITAPSDADNLIVVAIDPGHSEGTDSGAIGVGGTANSEAALNWKIANACKTELERYGHVKAFLTRTQYEEKSIANRALYAIGSGADVIVSIHLNSTTGGSSGSAQGSEVYVPSGVDYNYETHTVGVELAESILEELESLGLQNRGVKTRPSTASDDLDDYEDGSTADYYGIIRYARKAGIPGIIVEHAFIDNTSDYQDFLSSDEKLASLGVADAQGVANAYGLSVITAADLASVYDFDYYLSHNADVKAAYGGDADAVFTHFLTYGMDEGRQASEGFDPAYYRNANRDLRVTFGNDLMRAYYYHYVDYGLKEGRAGTGSATPVNTMWRMYNHNTGEHLFTASDYERNVMVYQGWTFERAGWSSPQTSSKRVWRLYNSHVEDGDHHYTTDEGEKNILLTVGWSLDSAELYSASPSDAGAVPVYRLYNPNQENWNHHYTKEKGERDILIGLGWKVDGVFEDEGGNREEGVGFYAFDN